MATDKPTRNPFPAQSVLCSTELQQLQELANAIHGLADLNAKNLVARDLAADGIEEPPMLCAFHAGSVADAIVLLAEELSGRIERHQTDAAERRDRRFALDVSIAAADDAIGKARGAA